MYLDWNGTSIIVTFIGPKQFPRDYPEELKIRYTTPWIPSTVEAWHRSMALVESNAKECPVCHRQSIGYSKGATAVSPAFQEHFGIAASDPGRLFRSAPSINTAVVQCGYGREDSWGIVRIQDRKVGPKTLWFQSKDWKI